MVRFWSFGLLQRSIFWEGAAPEEGTKAPNAMLYTLSYASLPFGVTELHPL